MKILSSRPQKVVAAEGDGNPKLDEALSALGDDFDYVIAGLERLGRSGAEASNTALILAEKIQTTISETISEIGSEV